MLYMCNTCAGVCVLSQVWLFVTPWTVAHQTPLSIGFPGPEYWSGLPFPPPGNLLDPGIEPVSLASPAWADRFFTTRGTAYTHTHTHVCCCLVIKSCSTLCDFIPGSSVLHCLLKFAQIHVHWVGDAFWPSHPLLWPLTFAFNLSQHQGLFQWVGSLHQVAKILELQLQHQSFQWIFRVDFL